MLFHATHKHSYQTCHAHDDKRKAKMMESIQSADGLGIKVHGVYVDPPGHVFFFILEADEMEQIVKFFDPIFELGDANIRPVMSMQDALAAIAKE